MNQAPPNILVTGVAGNLGMRLVPLLAKQGVIGVDMRPPAENIQLKHFQQLDLGKENSCDELVKLLREFNIQAVVHLAFVIDPLQTGVLDKERMWQINVAGTARVMEAIAEVNRQGGHISKFIFPSSVSAYGPETPALVKEDFPLGARSLSYAIHKQQCDEVVQFRAAKIGECTTYILRPHIFVGASVNNYLVGALRGTPTGKGRLAVKARAKGRRLPLLVPSGDAYLKKKIQFVHVDDVARLIAFLVEKHSAQSGGVHILNVAGSGDALTMQECASIAGAKLLRLPTKLLGRLVLELMWKIGLSGVPPEAFPYIIGSYTMDTARLQSTLGSSYKEVIRYSVSEALADTFTDVAVQSSLTERAAASD
jgi:nucleoside-diphosphate-sugar epimerase